MPALKYTVALDSQQEKRLHQMIHSGKWHARSLIRTRILLAANGNHKKDPAIAREVGCSQKTIANIRKRFVTEGIAAALFDKPRSGQPVKLNSKDEAYVVSVACTDPPAGEDHWTIKLLTQRFKHVKGKTVCYETIRQALLRNNQRPWLKKNVVYSNAHTGV